MNNAGQKFVVGGICRPYGAWRIYDVLATKMPLLAHYHFELCHILERVEWFKSLRPEEFVENLPNIGGIKKLIDSNIPVFERGAALFAAEVERIRSIHD
ncbi:MAG TPA: hypothetical protein VGM58_06230 [Verrucomicrobiae bacterium]|jgi:hypothetical protein